MLRKYPIYTKKKKKVTDDSVHRLSDQTEHINLYAGVTADVVSALPKYVDIDVGVEGSRLAFCSFRSKRQDAT